jgi:tRNA(fMet)-specific endonuclease VapC
MAERYLIDTSAIIKYLNATFSSDALRWIDEIIDQESLISFISEIELQVWNPPDPEDLKIYQQFVSSSYAFGIDDRIIAETIQIRKLYRIKLPDALIAATVLVYDLTLVADNNKDYNKISNLKYINPASIGKST